MAEPDQSDYAAFNLDADYEGGQWIGGEFFYQNERKKRKTTKEDHIYGVFNEGEEEEEEAPALNFYAPKGRYSLFFFGINKIGKINR